MIQFNLLPDVKLEYIKAKRMKRLAFSSALIVVAVSLSIFIFMFIFVNAIQKQHLKNLDSNIDKDVAEIQQIPEINEILTVQNQLSVINGKHDEKPATVRTLRYVSEVLPENTSITSLNVDYKTNKITIGGKTKDLAITNKFVDTLKFTEFETKSGKKGKPFSAVVLKSYNSDKTTGGIEYSVVASFDPLIFDNNEEVTLVVPGIVSTRSSTEKPNINFEPSSQPQESGGQ